MAPVDAPLRIALLSDIHGNGVALEAVLADIKDVGGVDQYWVLGDLVAMGPDPLGALALLRALPNARFTRGNTERYLIEGMSAWLQAVAASEPPHDLISIAQVVSSVSWTNGMITATGAFDWLASLSLEQRTTLPDGTRLLGVHASPGMDDGTGLHPGLSQAELRAMLEGCEADLVCVGHTHWPSDITVDDIRFVNLGSLSNPLPPDLRASYVLLEADAAGYRLEHRRVEYNPRAAIAQVAENHHPHPAFITGLLEGKLAPSWLSIAQNEANTGD